MYEKAIIKSNDRLRVANKAIKRLKECENHTDFCDEWFTFIVSTKSIWSDLQQGSKSNAQSRQWFGAKQSERKKSPVLQYMFIARNDDQHGLGNSLELKSATVNGQVWLKEGTIVNKVKVNGLFNSITAAVKDKNGNREVVTTPLLNKRFIPAKTILMDVKDRANKVVSAPDVTPLEAADETLRYLTSLVEGASKLCKP